MDWKDWSKRDPKKARNFRNQGGKLSVIVLQEDLKPDCSTKLNRRGLLITTTNQLRKWRREVYHEPTKKMKEGVYHEPTEKMKEGSVTL